MQENSYITPMRLLYINFFVVFAYFLFGYAGTFLNSPPAQASPVWPASGLALATMLVYGKRILPGLFLGVLAIQIYAFLDFSTPKSIQPSIIIGTLVSIGACTQAILGAYLIKHHLGKHNLLIEDSQIIRFFILGAPISCLVAPTVGILTLYFQALITPEDVLLSWSTWWIGDCIGVIVFTPITLSFIAKQKFLGLKRRKFFAYPLLVMICLVISIFYYNQNREASRITTVFDRQVTLLQATLENEIQRHVEINQILKGFFDSSEQVTEQEFLTMSWPIIKRHQSIQALEWISFIPFQQRKAFESHSLIIREPDQEKNMMSAADRPEYFPITYVQPFEDNRRALGFNVGSNPIALSALKNARDTGNTTVTKPLQLIQDFKKKTGIVIYSPVYKKQRVLDSIDDKRLALKGFTATVFRVDDEINEAFSYLSDVQLLVKIEDHNKKLFSNFPDIEPANLLSLQKVKQIKVADRIWTLTYQPSPFFYHSQLSWNIWWLLLSGLVITSFSSIGLIILSGHTLRTEELVRTRTLALTESEEHYRELVQAQLAIVWRADPNTFKFTFVSNEAEKILGYPVEQWLEEDSFWTKHMHKEDLKWAPEFCLREIKKLRGHNFEYRMWSKSGEVVWLRDVVNVIAKNGVATELVGAMIDITEQKKAEQEIYQLAFFDSLTGLANRSSLLNQLNAEISVANRNSTFGAIIFLDLDRFKIINDSLGHHMGDKLLIQVAKRIKSALREEDLPARFGGDEFVVLIRAHEPNLEQATKSTLVVAEKIRNVLEQSYLIDNYEHHCSSSIGITLYPERAISAADLIQQADKAMYRSKDQGRNTISFFHPSIQEAADAKLFLEKELRLALKKHDFILFFQPQIDQSACYKSSEALIRWQHPERGLISPADFIPVAEESKLIIPLGLWVLNQACVEMKNWLNEGLDLHHVSINVSSKQFRQADFVEQVEHSIRNNKLLASHLFIELTEGVVIDDIDDTIKKMQALKKIGVKISIDDFGMGYSSLSYLKQLPIDQLKIDQSFIRDVTNDENSAVIVETIINMAHNLKLDVIAEGVETQQQKDFLIAKGCSDFQGYYFSKPLPADEFTVFIKNHSESKE